MTRSNVASGFHLAKPVSADDCTVAVEPLPALDQLQSIWRDLESVSNCSFFLTWYWIGTWLRLIANRSDARLVTVTLQSRIVAMGVFTAKRAWRRAGPVHLRLHETGDPVLDNLTIEYNGLLCAASLEQAALAATVRFLERSDRRWSTVDLPGIDAADLPLQQLTADFGTMRLRRRPTHHVDLAMVRAGGDYLGTLGAQTRSAIRRTGRKITARFGELSTTVADTPASKLAYLQALARLHEIHWRAKAGEAGAFGDARIMAFHQYLLTTCAAADSIHLMRLSAGDQVIGYVYNFVHRGIVYFYQAGIDYEQCEGYGSPGLLLLSRAVELASASGHDRFEFMAGDADYKRRLGTGEGELVWLSLDRAGVASQLRSAARWLRVRMGAVVS